MVAEQRNFWRKIWRVCVGLGVALSSYLLGKLALSDGIEVSISNHSLAYRPLFNDPSDVIVAAYVALTTLPCIIPKTGRSIYSAVLFSAAFLYPSLA